MNVSSAVNRAFLSHIYIHAVRFLYNDYITERALSLNELHFSLELELWLHYLCAYLSAMIIEKRTDFHVACMLFCPSNSSKLWWKWVKLWNELIAMKRWPLEQNCKICAWLAIKLINPNIDFYEYRAILMRFRVTSLCSSN